MLNDAQVTTHPTHWVGIGQLADSPAMQEKGIAGLTCQVYDIAPRGYLRVYWKPDPNVDRYEGPCMVLLEDVQITG